MAGLEYDSAADCIAIQKFVHTVDSITNGIRFDIGNDVEAAFWTWSEKLDDAEEGR